MLEAELERKVVQWVEAHGGVCLKLALTGRRGFPDRHIILPGWQGYVELKQKKVGRVSPHQTAWMLTLNRLNPNTAFICNTLEDFVDFVRKRLDEAKTT